MIPLRSILVLLAFLPTLAVADGKRAPLAHAPLTWDMDPTRAARALTRAKLAPRHDERRMYTRDSAHTVEPELHWVIAHGRAEARFQWSHDAKVFRLDEIQLVTSLAPTALRRELARLERRYGKPHKSTPTQRLWVRNGIWLVVNAAGAKTGRFDLSVHYRRDNRPPP